MSNTPEKPVPTVKDGLTSPIKPTDATILKAIHEGKTPAEAVKEAGLALHPTKANNYVDYVKEKYKDAQGGLLVELESVGVNMGTVAQTIKDGLEATRPAKAGKAIIDKPDFSTRHKYLETTLDIMGGRAPKHQIVDVKTTHEEKVVLVDNIRKNPAVLQRLQERLSMRAENKVIEVKAEVDEATE